MTNLDKIFKSRDITLPTKVRLVKAMVFLVVMYGCESWTGSHGHRSLAGYSLWVCKESDVTETTAHVSMHVNKL